MSEHNSKLKYKKGFHFCTDEFDEGLLDRILPYKYYYEEESDLSVNHTWLCFDANENQHGSGFYTSNCNPLDGSDNIISGREFINQVNTLISGAEQTLLPVLTYQEEQQLAEKLDNYLCMDYTETSEAGGYLVGLVGRPDEVSKEFREVLMKEVQNMLTMYENNYIIEEEEHTTVHKEKILTWVGE
jgi:hypothetical protein